MECSTGGLRRHSGILRDPHRHRRPRPSRRRRVVRRLPLGSTGHAKRVFDRLGLLCLSRIPRRFTSGDRSVELRRLGTSGLGVSALSLGAMTFGASQTLMKRATPYGEEARRFFDRALEAGINLVDTANVYNEGRSEELTGEWVAGKRDQLLIATKCRFPIGFGVTHKPGPYEWGLSRKAIMTACEGSLRRLKTDVIDLYADSPLRVHPTPVVASPALGRARTHSCRGGVWARRSRLGSPLAGLSIRKIPTRPNGAGGISPRRKSGLFPGLGQREELESTRRGRPNCGTA